MKKLSAQDRKYIAEYKAWFDKLPNKQKAIMKVQKLDKPHIDDYCTKQLYDVSDIQIADPISEAEEFDQEDDEKIYSRFELRTLVASYIEKILHEVARKRNLSLTIGSMLWIIGKSPYATEQQIAKALGVTRASVSARCVELKDKFGLENTFMGKPLSTRERNKTSTQKTLK